MKILKKTLVAAAIATAVSATGAAQAATIVNHASTQVTVPATFGGIIVNEVVKTEVDLQPYASGNDFEMLLGALEALAEEDSITLTLNNGAVWKNIAATSVRASVGNGGGTAANVALVSGGPGSNTAVFRVTTGGIPGGLSIQLDPAASINMAAVPANGKVTITGSMSGFVGGIATSLYGSPLTFNAVAQNNARTATITAAANGVFSVATGFSTLTPATAAPSTSSAANITVVNGLGATVNGTTANGAGIPTGIPTVGANFVTITGPMTGVASINSLSSAILQSSSAGVAVAPAAAGMAVDLANNAAYGVLAALSAADITITFDGTTAYDVSAYTANVATTADGSYPAVASIGTGTTHTFSRNGSSFTTNSFGPLNKLTVTDLSGAVGAGGADGAIAITAYDAAGVAVTCTGLTVANVPANGTTTIQGADVAAACPGAKRIDGIVNSTGIQSTNTKLTSTGATSQSGVTVLTSSAISN